MERHETKIMDGTLYIESDKEWLEIGDIEDICELVGGETYTIEYNDRQRTQSWLDTDEEGQLTFDVRETLARMDYDDEFFGIMAQTSHSETNEDEYSNRTTLFADLMTDIWDSKGNFDI